MSVDANALERETLERKDRDELQKIVGALGGRATTRTRKADLIDQILELTGVAGGDGADSSDPKSSDGKSSEAKGSDANGSGGRTSESKGSDSKASDSKGSDSKGSSAPSSESAEDASDDDGDDDKASSGSRSGGRQGGGRNEQSRNQGSGQTGNQGSGNQASGNQGSGNQGSGNQGSGNQGSGNQASGNQGSGNQGRGNGSDGNGQTSDDDQGDGDGKRRRRRGRNREGGPSQEEFTGEPIPVVGCLDLRDDGYGFLRVDGLLPSKDDCYVSVKQVRQLGLRKGDVVEGGSRPAFRNEKNPAIVRIDTVNGVVLEAGTERPAFEDLRAGFANEQITLTLEDEADDALTRAIDLLAPVGKGSRVLVLAPPRSGKTTLLQAFARAVEVNEPDTKLLVVLLDERPEEITEMRELVAGGDVHGTSFDANPEDHVASLELALANAQRIAESGDDVVVLVDGLTRLARASHAASPGVGRTLGGLDVAAVQAAKRCFGAGRNLADAGSVTLVATANVDTLSEADEAVVDALVGAATTQIRLDGFAAGRRAFPAIDVALTGTRREELLVGDDGAAQREALRRTLAELPDGAAGDNDVLLDGLLARLRDTGSNDELLAEVTKG